MTTYPEYYDISPIISPETAVFPGDRPFSRKVAMDMKSGDHLTLSEIQTTLHIGAHADAPSHYDKAGQGIHERSLKHYIGGCQVVDVSGSEACAGEGLILEESIDWEKILSPRVLFKTNSFPDPNVWNSKFWAIHPKVIERLAEKAVITVGIDTPSVDPETSKKLDSHKLIAKNDMAILEGLVLKDVPEGAYLLIAAPLRIQDGDASPVRAVLFQDGLRLF